jgi:hypothetical protein
MLEILIHANIGKVDGVFTARVRTEGARELVAKRAKEKGLEVNIELVPAPRYFKDSKSHLEHLTNTNKQFANAVKQLGLKLLPETYE